jgi:hypothetical protein
MKKISALLAAAFLVALMAVSLASAEAPPANVAAIDPTAFGGNQDLVLELDLLAPVPLSSPMNLKCSSGPFAPVTGTFHDVTVPNGTQCYLAGATVTGNVTVKEDAGLRSDGSNIHGNLQADHSAYIAVGFPGGSVGGNIQIQATKSVPAVYGAIANYICRTPVGNDLQVGQSAAAAKFNIGGVGGPPGAPVGFAACSVSNSVGGNIQATNNAGELWISNNTVDGNLQAGSNTGGLHIYFNTIGGNLQCGSNNPPPDGAGNTVGGSAQGQCATPVFP